MQVANNDRLPVSATRALGWAFFVFLIFPGLYGLYWGLTLPEMMGGGLRMVVIGSIWIFGAMVALVLALTAGNPRFAWLAPTGVSKRMITEGEQTSADELLKRKTQWPIWWHPMAIAVALEVVEYAIAPAALKLTEYATNHPPTFQLWDARVFVALVILVGLAFYNWRIAFLAWLHNVGIDIAVSLVGLAVMVQRVTF